MAGLQRRVDIEVGAVLAGEAAVIPPPLLERASSRPDERLRTYRAALSTSGVNVVPPERSPERLSGRP